MRGSWLLFAFVLVTSLVALGTLCEWLSSFHAYGEHTRAQVSLAIVLCILSATWLAAELCEVTGRTVSTAGLFQPVPVMAPEANVIGANAPDLVTKEHSGSKERVGVDSISSAGPDSSTPLGDWLVPLRACGELSAIVVVIYTCDRTDIFAKGGKVYDRRQFWGLWALVMVAALLSMRTLESAKPIQREQTDEWKGWMQLMFVMYHYFKEEEVYNAIRVYIAAYVFMTGYGNFSLYARGKSFTTRRNMQMMFRLNFLGLITCVALHNEYLLYYICAMHTLFTVFVILVMYIKSSLNSSRKWIYAKFALTLVGILFIYDGPYAVFRAIFGTIPGVHFLFAFHDPVHPEFTDDMHEWHFRSGLDRFIWILGMVYALHFPDFEAFMGWLAEKKPLHRAVWNAGLLAVAFCATAVWLYFVFSKGKYAYNAVHAYTSWLPITVYLLVRNLTAPLRRRYLALFAYLGKYTLETYIMQFHVWMKTTGINGSPKHLLVVVPGHYWLNFAVVSAGYLLISVRLCTLTVTLRDALIPDQNWAIAKRWASLTVLLVACWAASFLFSGPARLIAAGED